MVRTSSGVSGRDVRELAGEIVGQCRLVGRVLPFELVHIGRNILLRSLKRPGWNRCFQLYLREKLHAGQHPGRMGASRTGIFAFM